MYQENYDKALLKSKKEIEVLRCYMKKICFITTIPLTLKSFVLKTAIYLHENTDWDISFICSNDDEFANSLPEFIHFFPVQMERGISISGIKAMLEMKKIFKREKFDLIQYSTPNASLYAALAGKMAKIPVRLYCQWGLVFVGFSGLKRKIFKIEEKIVCKLSTWIEPDSKSNLKFAHSERLYPMNKGSVIWNGSACGVDLDKFHVNEKNKYREIIRKKYGIPKEAFVYGFVGRITRDKGINELLEAFQCIYETNKDIYLMMVGASENDSTVDMELFNWSQNCSHVIYTGYTNVVEQFLSAMDVYILPSYREGFGMGVVEAEAMGVPVIVTDIPGPTDAMLNNKTGFIVEKKDVYSLTEAMRRTVDNPDLMIKYGENAKIYASKNFEQKCLFEHILNDRKKLLKL